jgi:hypothetical protein
MRIFLSYRREDSSAHAGRLCDALVRQFGQSNVFQDVVAIGAGKPVLIEAFANSTSSARTNSSNS